MSDSALRQFNESDSVAEARTIHVAEATCFTLLRVMKSPSPVDGDVALLSVKARGALHAATSANAAEFEQTVEDGTIVAHVVFALLFRIVVHVVWCHF